MTDLDQPKPTYGNSDVKPKVARAALNNQYQLASGCSRFAHPKKTWIKIHDISFNDKRSRASIVNVVRKPTNDHDQQVSLPLMLGRKD